MGKRKGDFDFNVGDLPDGVTLTTNETPVEKIDRKNADIRTTRQQTINDIYTTRRRHYSHRVTAFRIGRDEVTKPGKVRYLMSTEQEQFQALLDLYNDEYGDRISGWMNRYAHNNTQLINKSRDLTFDKVLLIGSLLLGPETLEEHAARINFIIKNGEFKSKYEFTTEKAKRAIKALMMTTGKPFNHLSKYIQSGFEKGAGKDQPKKYWFPPEFMVVDPLDLYTLSIKPTKDSRPYTENQLKVDARDYFVRIGEIEPLETEEFVTDEPQEQVDEPSGEPDFRTAVETALAAGMAALRNGNAIPKGVSVTLDDKDVSIHIEKLIIQVY